MPSQKDSHNLDLLRSIAVLQVLVFHLLLFFGITHIGPWPVKHMGGGGVLFFFVHTSLVLMFSLERLQAKLDGVKLFIGFMIRRCFRIYPLSLLVVLTVYFLRLPLGHLVHGRLEWVDMS